MYFAPYPEHTKQTRTNNNLNNQNTNDFFRPVLSNPSIPINFNHDHYSKDIHTSVNQQDLERSSISTRNMNVNIKKPVQNEFQNNYYTTNYDTLNNNPYMNNLNDNDSILTRNPVNTRRDALEKSRNVEKQDFMSIQGGALNNFTDFKYETTRKSKNNINTSSYITMPRTMAIPKENI
jgi:hypothetical protein